MTEETAPPIDPKPDRIPEGEDEGNDAPEPADPNVITITEPTLVVPEENP